MHRDVKLGLALAVLLIGSTTAFFFRDPADLDAGLPQLQNPERLDGEIARRGIVPYLGEPEVFELAASDSAADDEGSIWRKPAFLGGISAASYRRTSVTPDPIQIILEEDAEQQESLGISAAPMLMKPGEEPNGERQYIVQPGDTLTGLAARFLGSLSRYHEIYELNRDQLSGPDDLRIGLTLRIPAVTAVRPPGEVLDKTPHAGLTVRPGEASSVATVPEPPAMSDPATQPSSAGTASEGSSTGDRPVSEKLFVPAKKPPFVPRRYRSRTHSPASDAPANE